MYLVADRTDLLVDITVIPSPERNKLCIGTSVLGSRILVDINHESDFCGIVAYNNLPHHLHRVSVLRFVSDGLLIALEIS